MAKIQLTLHSKQAVLAQADDEGHAHLAWCQQYAAGDYYEVTVAHAPCFVVVQLDGSLAPALLYLQTATWRFAVPQNTQREWPYPEAAFAGMRHYASVRYAQPAELKAPRNLAVNTHDQRAASGAFPHASANAETRGELVFFAKNAIDGIAANESHGNYPFQSWGVDMRDDAEWTLAFGRPVTIDTLALTLRADYPHDSYWTQATVAFADGSHERLTLAKTAAEQRVTFAPRTVEWLRLERLVKAPDSSTFPALTQLAVFGTEA